jgi:hypothetical protein
LSAQSVGMNHTVHTGDHFITFTLEFALSSLSFLNRWNLTSSNKSCLGLFYPFR